MCNLKKGYTYSMKSYATMQQATDALSISVFTGTICVPSLGLTWQTLNLQLEQQVLHYPILTFKNNFNNDENSECPQKMFMFFNGLCFYSSWIIFVFCGMKIYNFCLAFNLRNSDFPNPVRYILLYNRKSFVL